MPEFRETLIRLCRDEKPHVVGPDGEIEQNELARDVAKVLRARGSKLKAPTQPTIHRILRTQKGLPKVETLQAFGEYFGVVWTDFVENKRADELQRIDPSRLILETGPTVDRAEAMIVGAEWGKIRDPEVRKQIQVLIDVIVAAQVRADRDHTGEAPAPKKRRQREAAPRAST